MKLLFGKKNVSSVDERGVELKDLSKEQTREFILQERPLHFPKDKYSQEVLKSYKLQWFFLGDTDDHLKTKDSKLTRRDALVYDIEYGAPEGFPEALAKKSGYEVWYYTTVKHQPMNPRYRVIIPFKEPLVNDEESEKYEAVCIQFAKKYGFLEICDTATWSNKQAMFLNHVFSDTEEGLDHESGYFEGKELDYIEFLKGVDYQEIKAESKRLDDLHDKKEEIERTEPLTEPETKETKKPAMVAEPEKAAEQRPVSKFRADPKKYHNLTGAVARAYGIREGIEHFLSDYLEPVEGRTDRYRDKQKTSSPGIVISEAEEGYHDNNCLCHIWHSHHGLYDHHLHTLLDLLNYYLKDKAPDAIKADEKIQEQLKLIEKEKQEWRSQKAVEPVKKDPNWLESLKKDEDGKIIPSIKNIRLIIENDPKLSGIGYRDTLAQVNVRSGDLFWRKKNELKGWWVDDDFDQFCEYMEDAYGIRNERNLQRALNNTFDNRRKNPACDFFLMCSKFDWRKECPFPPQKVFYLFLGGEDTELKEITFEKLGVAAIARNFGEDIPFDLVTILYGAQGIGKTRFWKYCLLPNPDWYGVLTTLQGKEAMEAVQGKIIVDMDELQATSKAEADQQKAFITRTVDEFRPPYGRTKKPFPRRCVLTATTNKPEFLRDATGERRHIVIECTGKDENGTPLQHTQDRNFKVLQENIYYVWSYLWEKYQLYLKGEFSLDLTEEEEKLAEEAREPFRVELSEEAKVRQYLELLKPEQWQTMDLKARRDWILSGAEYGTLQTTEVSTLELACEIFKYEPNDSGKEFNALRNRLSTVLTKLGYVSSKKQPMLPAYGVRTRVWVKA